jgi:hypothetical protein
MTSNGSGVNVRTNPPNQFYSALTGSRPLPAFMNPENIGRIVAEAMA